MLVLLGIWCFVGFITFLSSLPYYKHVDINALIVPALIFIAYGPLGPFLQIKFLISEVDKRDATIEELNLRTKYIEY